MRGLQEKSTPPETVGHASRESAPLLLTPGLGDWENYFAPFDLRLEVGEDEKEYQKEYQETFTNITNISINTCKNIFFLENKGPAKRHVGQAG